MSFFHSDATTNRSSAAVVSADVSESSQLSSRPSSPFPSGSAARVVRALRTGTSSESDILIGTSDLTTAFMEMELNAIATTGTTSPSLLMPPPTFLLSPTTSTKTSSALLFSPTTTTTTTSAAAVLLTPTPTLTFSTWLNRIEDFLRTTNDAVLLSDIGKSVPCGTGRSSTPLQQLLKRDERFELVGTGNLMRVQLRLRRFNENVETTTGNLSASPTVNTAVTSTTKIRAVPSTATTTTETTNVIAAVDNTAGKTKMVELAKAKRQLLTRLRGLQTIAETTKKKKTPTTPEEATGTQYSEHLQAVEKELSQMNGMIRNERSRASNFVKQEKDLDHLNTWLIGFKRPAATSLTSARAALKLIYANLYDVMDSNFIDHKTLSKLSKYTIKHKLIFPLKDAKEDMSKIFLKQLFFYR